MKKLIAVLLVLAVMMGIVPIASARMDEDGDVTGIDPTRVVAQDAPILETDVDEAVRDERKDPFRVHDMFRFVGSYDSLDIGWESPGVPDAMPAVPVDARYRAWGAGEAAPDFIADFLSCNDAAVAKACSALEDSKQEAISLPPSLIFQIQRDLDSEALKMVLFTSDELGAMEIVIKNAGEYGEGNVEALTEYLFGDYEDERDFITSRVRWCYSRWPLTLTLGPMDTDGARAISVRLYNADDIEMLDSETTVNEDPRWWLN